MAASTEIDEALDWHVGGLRDLAARLRGRATANELWLCLRAIDDRQFYAEYHLAEACRLVGEGLGGRSAARVWNDIVLGYDTAATEAFLVLRRQAWAHVIAYLQSLHAIADIMGHVLAFTLALPVGKRLISMSLARGLVTDLELSELLTSWLEHEEHAYLDAAVNFSKHHSLVREKLSFDLPCDRAVPFGVVLCSFQHKGRNYPEREFTDVLLVLHSHERPIVALVGRRINALLVAEGATR